MKKNKHIIIFCFLLLMHISFAQSFEIVLSVPWDTIGGISTYLSNSSNYGVSDFIIIDDNTVALLCNVENKVKVYNCNKNTLLYDFSLVKSVDHIAYDKENKMFYLDDYKQVYCYCADGSLKKEIEINRGGKLLTEDIIAENGNLIISNPILAGRIVENGRIISVSEQLQKRKNMAYIGNDVYVNYSKKPENGKAYINLYKNDTIFQSFVIDVEERYSTPLPIGISDNIFVYFQIYHPEDFYQGCSYRLGYYSLSSNAIIDTITTPSIHYTAQKTEYIVDDEYLYYLITAPDSLYVLRKKVNEITSKSSSVDKTIFPEKFNYQYHYNKPDNVKKKAQSINTTETPITDVGMRTEVLSRAYKYASIEWLATDDNIPGNNISNIGTQINLNEEDDGYSGSMDYYVTVPNNVSTTTNNIGMPYKWGGFTHYNNWDYLVQQGRITGDYTSTPGGYEANDNNVIGIDCSGLASRAWNLDVKQGTDYLSIQGDPLSNESDLEHGDFMIRTTGYYGGRKRAGHVRIIDEYISDNAIFAIGAEGYDIDASYVRYESFPASEWAYYTPRTMPRTDNDFDLTIDELDVSNSTVNSITINNIGNDSYYGELRYAIYNRPDSTAAEEVGELLYSYSLSPGTIFSNSSNTFTPNTNLKLYVSNGIYVLRIEYLRNKGDNNIWQEIPYENYSEHNIDDNLIGVGYNLITGKIDILSQGVCDFVVSEYFGLKSSTISTSTDDIITGSTTTGGNFTIGIPENWEKAKISFPNNTISDVYYTVGDGDLTIWSNSYTSTNNTSGGYCSTTLSIRYAMENYNGLTINQTGVGIPKLCNNDLGLIRTKSAKTKKGCIIASSFRLYYQTPYYNKNKPFDGCFLSNKRCAKIILEYSFVKLNNKLETIEDETIHSITVKDRCMCDNTLNEDNICIYISDLAAEAGYIFEEGEFYKLYINNPNDQNTDRYPYCAENSGSLIFYVSPNSETEIYKNKTLYNKNIYAKNEILISNAELNSTNLYASNKILINEKSTIKGNSSLKIEEVKSCGDEEGIILDETSKSISLKSSTNQSDSIIDDIESTEYLEFCNCNCNSSYNDNKSNKNTLFQLSLTDSIQIYPNPTESTFNIEYSEMILNVERIEIINILGQIIERRIPSSNVEMFDMSNKAKGLYLARIVYKNSKSESYKLVVE